MTSVSTRFSLLCGVALAILATQGPALAQEPTQLEQISVQGGGIEDDSGIGPVDGIVAKKTRTGSKSVTDVKEIPQSVSVVGREQIDDQSPRKADEALRYTAGVNASTFGTDADTDWVFIRGFQADQTGVFLDGLSLYQNSFGTFLIDPFFLERIEVIKGPGSALYGGANPGGFINYVSKRPTSERLRYAETGINNFGNGYLGFDIGDRIDESGTLSYRLTGKVSGGGWETDEAKDFRGTIAPSVTWQPDAATSLTILASYQHIDLTHTSTGFLPYEGTVVDLPGFGRIPRDFFYGDPDFDTYDRQQAMIGYEFSHTFDNDWTVRQNLRYAHVSLEEDALYGNGWDLSDPSRPLLNRYRFAHDTTVGVFTVDNQLEGIISTGALEHSLLLGFDYRNYGIDQTQGSGSASPINPFDPIYGDVPGPVSNYLDQDLRLSQIGFYAQDQIRFGDGWIVTLNGRYDFVSTDLEDRLTPANSVKGDDGEFTGRAALAYNFANGLTPYISYSTSFNPTTSVDGNGDLLRPETGKQWEVGVKYAPDFMDALFTAAYFDMKRQNVAGLDDSTPPRPAAIGEVEARGVELSAQANVTDNLKLIGALTYIDMEVTKATGGSFDLTPVGSTPIQVPDLTASLWLDYTFHSGRLEGLSLAAGVRHVGESWADRENTLKVPSATLFDAAIRYSQDNWSVALNVANLFDKKYVASCQGLGSCGYGAGRTITLKASTTW